MIELASTGVSPVLDPNARISRRDIPRSSQWRMTCALHKNIRMCALCIIFTTVVTVSLRNGNFAQRVAVDDPSSLATKKSEATSQKSDPASPAAISGPSNRDGPILDIRLLGERNSGTNWVDSILSECFPTMNTASRLTRWKHWFQEDGVDGIVHNRTLVVAQFRNPYDWSTAMRKMPHHSPSHVRLKWPQFMTKTWTTSRPESDKNYMNDTGTPCQDFFNVREIIACERHPVDFHPKIKAYSSDKPIYEMKKSGDPYDNILDLRAAKIYNHLSVKEWPWVADVLVVQYERLLLEGTAFFIRRVEELTGVEAQCEPAPPQPERLEKRRKIERDWMELITKNTDWEAEALIAYSPAKIHGNKFALGYTWKP